MKILQIMMLILFICNISHYTHTGLITQIEMNDLEKKTVRLTPISTTTFVNGRVNPILLTLTDKNNNIEQISITPGQARFLSHQAIRHFKKAICSEKNEKQINVSGTDLATYEVFVFNCDQKIDKYHFGSIKAKEKELQAARNSNDKKAFNDIQDYTVYCP